jgi:hypothetical protein
MNASTITGQEKQLQTSKPWELNNPSDRERYWTAKYEAWKQRVLSPEPESMPRDEHDPEVEAEREMWDYNYNQSDAEGDRPRFPNGVNFTPELFDWLPWGLTKFRTGNKSSDLNHQINISILSVIGAEENDTGALANDYKEAKQDHVVQISVAVEDLNETEPLTFTCNMGDSYIPRYPDSPRSENRRGTSRQSRESGRRNGDRHDKRARQPSNDVVEKQEVITKPISRSPSPGPSTQDQEMSEAPLVGSQNTKIMDLLKQISDAGQLNLQLLNAPSRDKSGTTKEDTGPPNQLQRRKTFISVSDEVMDNITKMTSQLNIYGDETRDMQRSHRREFESSRREFERIRDHASMFHQRTEDLIKNFRLTTSAMNRRFDLMDLQQQHAVDAARALKDVLLRIHHDSFSLDDYYLAINELLRGALTLLTVRFHRSNPLLIAFKNDMEGMFRHWNAMAPSPLHDGVWAAELTNIIATAKEGMRTVDLQPRLTPMQYKGDEPKDVKDRRNSKGKNVANDNSSKDGKWPSAPPRRQ